MTLACSIYGNYRDIPKVHALILIVEGHGIRHDWNVKKEDNERYLVCISTYNKMLSLSLIMIIIHWKNPIKDFLSIQNAILVFISESGKLLAFVFYPFGFLLVFLFLFTWPQVTYKRDKEQGRVMATMDARQTVRATNNKNMRKW